MVPDTFFPSVRRTAGTGHLYQGRFKSFVVQTYAHFLTVCRYVERNPLRANLVKSAENWRWGSLWLYRFGDQDAKRLLSDWPVERPRDWVRWVNRPERQPELEALRRCVQRGSPFGRARWVLGVVKRLGLQSTLAATGAAQTHHPVNGS